MSKNLILNGPEMCLFACLSRPSLFTTALKAIHCCESMAMTTCGRSMAVAIFNTLCEYDYMPDFWVWVREVKPPVYAELLADLAQDAGPNVANIAQLEYSIFQLRSAYTRRHRE